MSMMMTCIYGGSGSFQLLSSFCTSDWIFEETTISSSYHGGMGKARYFPRMFVQLLQGEDQGILIFIEGNLDRMNQEVPTIRIEQTPAIMQKFVVGIPPTEEGI